MNIVTDVVLPIALAFIMFSLGLGLSLNDFTRIFIKPKEFFIGFFSQLIILPIVALNFSFYLAIVSRNCNWCNDISCCTWRSNF